MAIINTHLGAFDTGSIQNGPLKEKPEARIQLPFLRNNVPCNDAGIIAEGPQTTQRQLREIHIQVNASTPHEDHIQSARGRGPHRQIKRRCTGITYFPEIKM